MLEDYITTYYIILYYTILYYTILYYTINRGLNGSTLHNNHDVFVIVTGLSIEQCCLLNRQVESLFHSSHLATTGNIKKLKIYFLAN